MAKFPHLSAFQLRTGAAMLLVGTVLGTPAPADAFCGNGMRDADEECDDGGVCIGGVNAGTHCTLERDCTGSGVCVDGLKSGAACDTDAGCAGGRCIHCKTLGGDGCAANCTAESDVPFPLVPGVAEGADIAPDSSGLVIHNDILTIPLPLRGTLTLTIGKERGGEIPVVVKARAAQLPRIPVSTLACACVRGVAAKTCGGTFFEADGVSLSPDCTSDDSACAGKKPCTFLHGEGNAAAGSIDCRGGLIDGVNLCVTQDAGGTGPAGAPLLTFGGLSAAGSARILASTAVGSVVGLCAGTIPEYGRDGEFCTDDDPQSARGTPTTQPFVTGTASAEVFNANDFDGNTIGPLSVTGKPFDCTQLAAGITAGACLASAYTALDQPAVGDYAVTTLLCAQRPCDGDCNGDGFVIVNELITQINILLGNANPSSCPSFGFGCCPPSPEGEVCVLTIVCAFQPIINALNGCPP